VPTPDPYLSPPSGTLPRRRLAGRGGEAFIFDAPSSQQWVGTRLFELSVGLDTDMVTPRNRFFFRGDRGQRELSDDVGPCGAMVIFSLTSTSTSTTRQGGKAREPLD
jgi:hypothetical protein